VAKSREKPGTDWFSKAEVCAFQGIAAQTFDRTYRPRIPPAAIRTIGGRVWYHGPTYFESVVLHKAEGVKAAQPPDDPMLAGGDSPALEEYRKHRARVAKVDADLRERLVVEVGVIEPAIMSMMGLVRRGAETIQRQHGNEAAKPLVEAIDEALSNIEGLFSSDGIAGQGTDSPRPGGGSPLSPTDDAGIRRV
jgi:hypothetical protein